MNDRRISKLTDAQRDLAAANTGLAYALSRKLAGTVGPLDADELLSACLEGLIYAARKFDPARGIAFSTYAWRWMRQRAQDAGRKNHLIPVPRHAAWGRAKSVHCHLSARQAMAMRRVGFGMVSPVAAIDRGQDEVDAADQLERITAAMTTLDHDQRFVIEQRLAGRTLREIGTDLDVCRERARQIEQEAHKRIRVGIIRLARARIGGRTA